MPESFQVGLFLLLSRILLLYELAEAGNFSIEARQPTFLLLLVEHDIFFRRYDVVCYAVDIY